MARTMPFVFEGILMTSLKGREPFITAGLLESTQDGFFANGATFFGSVALPLNKFITPGHYVVTGSCQLDRSHLARPDALRPDPGVRRAARNGKTRVDVRSDDGSVHLVG